MKWEVKDEKNCKKVISVHVDAEKVTALRKKIFEQVKAGARVDGYRKGKVPESIVEKMYAGTIREELLKEIVPETYTDVMKELKLHVVTQPWLEDIKFAGKDEAEVEYKIAVEVNPEVKVKDYKGIKLNIKELKEVSDKDIECEINKLRQYRGTLKDTTKEKVEENDFATVSYSGFLEGVARAEMTSTHQVIQLGAGAVIADLEKGIKGMKVGEEKDIDAVFPKDYHSKEFAGKKAVFKVKLKQIKVLEMPEANDDFAKSLSEKFQNMADLKAAIKEELTKQAEADIKNARTGAVIKHLVEKNEFEVPNGLVEDELDNMIARYGENLKSQGLSIEKLGIKQADLRNNSRKQAEENIRLIYILRAVAEAENIKAEDSDVEAEIKKIADNMKQDPSNLMKQAKARGSWDALKAKLLEDKVFEFLFNNAK